MPDLAFALDDLYAAGWWPMPGDDCLKTPSGRWYPTPDLVRSRFRERGIELTELNDHSQSVHKLIWNCPESGMTAMIARDPQVIAILAFTWLFRFESRTRAVIYGS